MATMNIVSVTPFSGKQEDFFQWKNQFITKMILAKLAYLIDDKDGERTQHPTYKDDNWLLMGYIRLSLPENFIYKLNTFGKKGDEAWLWLCNKFEKSKIHHLKHWDTIFTITYQANEDVELWVSKVKSVASQIADIVGKYPESETMLAISRGLPENYLSLIDTATVNGKCETVDDLEKLLITASQYYRDLDTELEICKKKGPKCFKCKKRGHKKSDCTNE